MGEVIATLRARLDPTCESLVEELKAAFNVTDQRLKGVNAPAIPRWNEITSQHWIFFHHLSPVRMAAIANAEVVASYGIVVANADQIRPAKGKDRRIAERASVDTLEAVSPARVPDGS